MRLKMADVECKHMKPKDIFLRVTKKINFGNGNIFLKSSLNTEIERMVKICTKKEIKMLTLRLKINACFMEELLLHLRTCSNRK